MMRKIRENKSPPRISVLMLLHNRPQFMRESIESVIHQTFDNFEFIILDNGSEGKEVYDIAKTYADTDPRISLSRSSENLGVHKGRNALLKLASGQYIATVEDDDYWVLDKLQKQIDFMDAHSSVAVYACSHKKINSVGEIIGNSFLKREIYTPTMSKEDLILINNYSGSGQIFRHDALLTVGAWREYFVNADDTDLFFRLQEKFSYATTDESLIYYRLLDARKNNNRKLGQSNLSAHINAFVYALAAMIAASFRREGKSDLIDNKPVVEDFVAENLMDVIGVLKEDEVNRKTRSIVKFFLRNRHYLALRKLTRQIALSQDSRLDKKSIWFHLYIWSFWYCRLGYWFT